MAAYLMKITAIGAAKVAAAQAGGPPVSITHMALGDGNGNPIPLPTGDETALVREVYRDQVSALYVNASQPNIFLTELVVPNEVGGWAVREVGVFDVDGDMIAYGNFPTTYKPIASEGSTREMVVRAAMRVASTDNIDIVIDGSVVSASRDWVLNTITPAYLLPGGLTGQHLAKASNADGHFTWADPAEGVQVVVDIIQEVQELAADQVVVTFADLIAEEAAIYIEGGRLIKGVDYTVDSPTQITLTEAYPAGSKLHGYQNDPLESADYLKPAMNLDDLSDKVLARQNLGVAGKSKLYFMGQI